MAVYLTRFENGAVHRRCALRLGQCRNVSQNFAACGHISRDLLSRDATFFLSRGILGTQGSIRGLTPIKSAFRLCGFAVAMAWAFASNRLIGIAPRRYVFVLEVRCFRKSAIMVFIEFAKRYHAAR